MRTRAARRGPNLTAKRTASRIKRHIRTRAYQAERVVQRGLLVGTSIRGLDVTAYLFNPDDSKPILVLAFAVSF